MTLEDIGKEINIESLEKENLSLKSKIEGLRANNNSYLYSALCRFQAEMPIVQKNSSMYGKQKYASFADIVRVSRPILVKNGLSISQTFLGDILITRLCHSSGQFLESNIKLITPDIKDSKINILQEIGKAITYLKRYSYMSIVGIATDDDTDGN